MNVLLQNTNQILRTRPHWWLVIGIITMTATHMSYNLDFVAWFSYVPFLIYLQSTKGWKSRMLLFLALLAAWSFIVLKIISDPIPWFFIFLYSLPIALFHIPAYLIGSRFNDRKWALFLFPAMLTLLEWIQYTFTPLASWGVAAYTQVDSPSISQFLSVFGMPGLSFLIYWVNSAIADIYLQKQKTVLNFYAPVLSFLAVLAFGTFRLENANFRGNDEITVAAIGTDSEIGGVDLPTTEKNENDIRAILRRSSVAAQSGAKIIVWNEGAFLLRPSNEKEWVARFQSFAREHKVTLVASYILLISETPRKYENKYRMIDPSGSIAFSYLKHQPVPGEPAVKGTSPIRVLHANEVNLGAAICYDYDFPYLARENERAGADIVALPSSDWRGIDPVHVQMAAFRAIEQGHSIVRATRFGLTGIISPYGLIISRQSSFDKNDKILIAQLPKKGITTIYSIIGDAFVNLLIVFLVLFFTLSRRKPYFLPKK